MIGRAYTFRQGWAGPGGKSGVLVWFTGVNVSSKPDQHDWRKCNGGAYWVGCHKKGKPRPEDLVTANLHPSHLVQMGDGNVWDVPSLVTFAGELIPCGHCLTLNDEDKVVAKLMPQYEELVQNWPKSGPCSRTSRTI